MAAPEDTDRDQAPFISHLMELRDRLMRAVIVVVVLLVPLAIFAQDLYTFLAGPLTAKLPADTNMIATEPTAPFLTPFKLALACAVVLAAPYILWQIWAFIAPGLYQQERRFAMPLMAMSTVLFYAGIAFAYFAVLPLVFRFIVGVVPTDVEMATDITRYLEFVIKLFIAFGAAFQIPVATVLMCRVGITTPKALAEKRPYVFVGAFAVGMLLTPPDAISQTLLALPTYLLFELGIVMARVLVRGHEAVDAQRERDD